MCQTSTPSCWGDKEAHHIINEPPFEVEDLIHRQKKLDQCVPEIHIPTRGHMVHENGVDDRSNQSQYLAHNSQNYLNHKSLELGIVGKRVVLVFVILFCFVVVVHFLFSKVVAHLFTLLL